MVHVELVVVETVELIVAGKMNLLEAHSLQQKKI